MNKSRQQLFEDIFSYDGEKILPVDSLSNYSDKSEHNLITATLLSRLGGFQALLTKSRIEIGIEPQFGIKHKLTLPDSKEVDFDILSLKIPLTPEQLQILNKSVDEMLDYFMLPPEWFDSIKRAILTHTIYLPPEPQALHFSTTGSPAKYPAIYISGKVSIHMLRQFIEDPNIKQTIRLAVEGLPKARETQIEKHTLQWGRAIAILMRIQLVTSKTSHANVAKQLTTLFKPTDVKNIPDAKDVRRIYENFLKYAIRLQPSLVMPVKFPPEAKS